MAKAVDHRTTRSLETALLVVNGERRGQASGQPAQAPGQGRGPLAKASVEPWMARHSRVHRTALRLSLGLAGAVACAWLAGCVPAGPSPSWRGRKAPHAALGRQDRIAGLVPHQQAPGKPDRIGCC